MFRYNQYTTYNKGDEVLFESVDETGKEITTTGTIVEIKTYFGKTPEYVIENNTGNRWMVTVKDIIKSIEK